jgi:hypothetical protein
MTLPELTRTSSLALTNLFSAVSTFPGECDLATLPTSQIISMHGLQTKPRYSARLEGYLPLRIASKFGPINGCRLT